MLLSARNGNKQEKSKQQQDRSRLIEIDKKYSLMMDQQSKKQVTDVLESQLDYLLGKKEIEKMKKRKLQELQDNYERERVNRITKMDLKISRSDQNRAQTLREKQTKSKRNLEFVDQKIKKKQHQNQKQIQKMLQAQRTYIKKTSQSRASLHSFNRSQSHLNSSKSFKPDYLKVELQKSLQTIDTKIEHIQSKIDQAKTNQKFYHRQKSEKAKSYSKNVDQTMSKIRTNDNLQETKCIGEYYNRMTHILNCQEKTKTFYQKQSQRRRKNIDDRFKKCNDNLKHLSRERESRFQKLQAKFEKRISPRTWKNDKNGIYLQKFIENHRQIEQQKLSKADGIVSKHMNLSIKNRVLREKKDRIFQTVKKVQI